MYRITTVLLTSVAMLASSPALACGGFFCSQTPIDQSAEHIVFSVNPETGLVDAHIQISYEGTAEDFAWVVPVQNQPELFVSTEQLFTTIDIQTDPQFWLDVQEDGDCGDRYYSYYGYESVVDYDGGYYDDSASFGGTVVIVDTKEVGPYETTTLQASTSEALLDWLQNNDYDLPDELGPVLDPYIAGNAFFVALRLSNDKEVGDIAPLGMTYEGDRGAIPIQLTSIAALPDMRLQVSVFGKARFVPESYLHVQINEAAINWLNGGNNYEAVVSQAANEAGGHAFATDFAGATEPFRGMLYKEGMYDTDILATIDDPADFVSHMLNQGFPSTATIQNIIRAWIPMPEQAINAGVDESSFYNCLDCYPEYTSLIEFDPVGMAQDLDELVVQPLVRAEALFAEHPYMSRMTSSLDAAEMTVDPIFVANFDMGDVDHVHEADLVYECGPGLFDWTNASRHIELVDGTIIYVPSEEWFSENDPEMDDYLDKLGENAAAVIERTGAEGQPEVLTDNAEIIDESIDDHNEEWGPEVIANAPSLSEAEATTTCGCTTGGAEPFAATLLLLGVALTRRRRHPLR